MSSNLRKKGKEVNKNLLSNSGVKLNALEECCKQSNGNRRNRKRRKYSCRKQKNHHSNDSTDTDSQVAEINFRCESITVQTDETGSSSNMTPPYEQSTSIRNNVTYIPHRPRQPSRELLNNTRRDLTNKLVNNISCKKKKKNVKHSQDRHFNKRQRKKLNSPSSSSSTMDQNNEETASTSEDIEIPGFYYDRAKKRYFRIVPGQSNAMSSVITRDLLSAQKAERKRQRDLLNQKDGRHKSLCTNICNMIRSREFGGTAAQFTNPVARFTRILAGGLRPRGSKPIFDEDTVLHSYNTLQHMTSMQPNAMGDSLLCMWLLKHIIGHRIQMLQLSGSRCVSRDTIVADVNPSGPAILQSLSQITSLCWALHIAPHTVLYTAMRHMGGGPSVALLRSLDCTGEHDYVTDEFNLGRGATWASAWDSRRSRFCVGMERHAVLLDARTRRLSVLNTRGSDAISHVFSQNTGNMLYSGTRSGLICGHDLRSTSTISVLHLKQSSSVCHLYHMSGESYLLASDFSGKINMWDLRKKAVVREFIGNNEYSRIPFHVDEQEDILCSAGQDCYTRLWCVRTGSLLCKLPPPYPASRESIPAVCFMPHIRSSNSLPGLLMGIRDELHVYSL